jgi:hypothetical protein
MGKPFCFERNLPWGVSESAWSALDSNQIYQYFAFGIPALGLNAPLDEGDVVAPYATMLGLQVDPAAAIENLERLNKMGLEGPMGLYESMDFTRQSTREGKRGVIVYSYMSHHQGMSLLALDNLCTGTPCSAGFIRIGGFGQWRRFFSNAFPPHRCRRKTCVLGFQPPI